MFCCDLFIIFRPARSTERSGPGAVVSPAQWAALRVVSRNGAHATASRSQRTARGREATHSFDKQMRTSSVVLLGVF